MAKEKEVSLNGFWRDMFQIGLYKRNQGRITRQLTFAALALIAGLGAWRLHDFFAPSSFTDYGVPWILGIVGVWLSFRVVNMPRFADFLIAVEAEMSKVSWPTRKELFRGSAVVIVTIVVLASVLVFFDFVWTLFLRALGVGIG